MSPRIGHHFWLLFMTVLVEFFMALKYAHELDIIKSYWPPLGILLPWVAFFALYSVFFLARCWQFYFLGSRDTMLPSWLLIVKCSAFVPLLALGRQWAY